LNAAFPCYLVYHILQIYFILLHVLKSFTEINLINTYCLCVPSLATNSRGLVEHNRTYVNTFTRSYILHETIESAQVLVKLFCDYLWTLHGRFNQTESATFPILPRVGLSLGILISLFFLETTLMHHHLGVKDFLCLNICQRSSLGPRIKKMLAVKNNLQVA
jgi:hypothetical protein